MIYDWNMYLHCLILLLGSAFLCFFPFREHLIGSKLKITVTTVSACVLFAFSAGIYDGYFTNAISPFFLIFAFYYFNKKIPISTAASVFVILTITSFIFFIGNLANSIFSLINEIQNSLFLQLLIKCSMFPLLYFVMRKFITPVLLDSSILYWKLLCLIPLIYSAIAIWLSFPKYAKPINIFIFSISILVLAIFTYTLILNLLKKTSDSIKDAQRAKEIENLLEMQKKSYLSLNKQIEAAKQNCHDQRHQYAVIQNFLNNNDIKNALSYIESLNGSIPNISENLYCNNLAVNAIINHYAYIAKKLDIKFELRLIFPENLKQVSETDLCVLIGNLFENAIEACSLIPINERFFKIKSGLYNNDYFIIVMQNSFDGYIKKTNEGFYSKKRTDSLGVGLKSIEAVCKKYNGSCSFESDKNIFHSSATIKIN